MTWFFPIADNIFTKSQQFIKYTIFNTRTSNNYSLNFTNMLYAFPHHVHSGEHVDLHLDGGSSPDNVRQGILLRVVPLK